MILKNEMYYAVKKGTNYLKLHLQMYTNQFWHIKIIGNAFLTFIFFQIGLAFLLLETEVAKISFKE